MIRRNVELEARLIDDLLDLTRIVRGQGRDRARPARPARRPLDRVPERAERVFRPRRTPPVGPRRAGALLSGRRRAAAAGLLEPAEELGQVHALRRRRVAADDESGARAHPRRSLGHRPGHPRRPPPEDLRSLRAGRRHRRAARGRPRPRPRDRAQPRAAPRRRDHGVERRRGPRRHVRGRAAPRRRTAQSSRCRRRWTPTGPRRGAGWRCSWSRTTTTRRRRSRALLAESGFDVRTADGIASAKRTFAERPADVLITDVGLPDGSGLDLLEALRPMRADLRAIVLSGYGMEEDLRRSRSLGFDEHFVKPINPSRLIAALDALAREPERDRPPRRAAADSADRRTSAGPTAGTPRSRSRTAGRPPPGRRRRPPRDRGPTSGARARRARSSGSSPGTTPRRISRRAFRQRSSHSNAVRPPDGRRGWIPERNRASAR